VTVGPGDEVFVHNNGEVVGPFKVIGYDAPWIVCESDGVDSRGHPYDGFAIAQLRTPDGRAVSGFRERTKGYAWMTSPSVGDDLLRDRIDELERELDEQCRLLGMGGQREAKLMAERDKARAERDEAQRDLEAFVEPEGDDPWVRLDDETIEKVAWVMFALDNAGPHHRYLHDKLRHCLRDLRDGSLRGGAENG